MNEVIEIHTHEDFAKFMTLCIRKGHIDAKLMNDIDVSDLVLGELLGYK